MSGHGGVRPGAGRPKGRKNKLTQERKATVSELAQGYTSEAIDVLAEIMRDDEAPHAARVRAAESLLDRGHGKPVQASVDLDPDKTELPFDGWTIERLEPDQPTTH